MIIFTNGVFDILHSGHISLLKFCRMLSTENVSNREISSVIVGINSDESVRRLKGPSRPVISASERAKVLESIKYVDHVYIFEEDTPIDLMDKIRPDIIVKSSEYKIDDVVGHEKYRTVLAPHVPNISTTNIVRKARGNFCE